MMRIHLLALALIGGLLSISLAGCDVIAVGKCLVHNARGTCGK